MLVLAYCLGLGLPLVRIGAPHPMALHHRLAAPPHPRLQLPGGARLLVLDQLLLTGQLGEFVARLHGPIAGYILAA